METIRTAGATGETVPNTPERMLGQSTKITEEVRIQYLLTRVEIRTTPTSPPTPTVHSTRGIDGGRVRTAEDPKVSTLEEEEADANLSSY